MVPPKSLTIVVQSTPVWPPAMHGTRGCVARLAVKRRLPSTTKFKGQNGILHEESGVVSVYSGLKDM